MRPLRIRVEGFSAYREAVDVDFTGVDFFSVTGPTGSGKSSLIDAMVFALYGRVPRLGGNAVAPAITAGVDRARVRLVFDVGETEYTVARVAQRTATGGATVREARLEQGDRSLASGADDVTTAVEELLRLRFDDFTRTVVLPQGDFARFLTATKAERQGLLRNLLGMEVYTRVRELAKTRAAVAGERADGARRVLESLELADDEETAAATERRDSLTALADSMVEREKTLAGLDSAVTDAEAGAGRLTDSIGRLGSIEAPDRLTELDTLMAEARSALVDSEEAHDSAVVALEEAEKAIAALPSSDQVAAWTKTRERLDEIAGRLSENEAEQAARKVAVTQTVLEEGISDLDKARSGLEAARSEHAAHVLTATLSVGEPCPVCAHAVTEIPDRPAPTVVEDLAEEHSRLSTTVDSLRKDAEEARTILTRVEASRAGLTEQQETLTSELEGSPSGDDLAGLEYDLKRLTGELETTRKELVDREAGKTRARTALEDLADESRRVDRLLREAERKVADLDPPLSESDDVVVRWKELVAWRERTLERLRDDLKDVGEQVAAAQEVAVVGRRELIETLEGHDVEAREPYAVQVATALHSARALVEAQEKAAQEAVELHNQAEKASAEAAVAGALANHLRANGFEQWLMAGALTDLVSGANELLGQLSGDGYSLHSDESGSFSIVDHHNADEMRLVSTLSGGETFLVSLALALSLAETLAAKGGSGLDAIILDEGFGTLDDESLDTVATVLEELTGRGLMVGVITHVKELAARAPVRYEVHRRPGGAGVRLVS